MKKLTSLLIGCSLALAGAALAQQPTPSKGKRAPEKARTTEAQQPKGKPAKPETPAAKQPGATKEPGATTERGATAEPATGKGRKTPITQESPAGRQAGAPTPSAKQQQAEQRRKGKKEPAAAAKTSPTPATSPAGAAAGAVSPAPAAGQQTTQATTGAKAKKPDPQKVQQIKSQHATFRAQPKPQQVPAVTFNQSRRIEGSERWQGPQYEVFRSYRPERHDQGWYHSHYSRVELIGGGYYFWNNGYWYPAWGYNPSAEYYAYDGPIYVGHRAEPPDKVIADVQAVLQEMGYYRGEVDGLLGPLTREALTAYQADNGLTTTAAIDQPTLDSLGMG
jgi:Putative peptidoglycan binding domain